MVAVNYLQVMIDSLDKKIDILERIQKLNEEQSDILKAADFTEEKFMDNAEKKSGCIEEIDKLDEGFQSLYNRVKQELEQNKSSYKDQIETLKVKIKVVTELGVGIEAQEKRNRSLAEKKFNSIRQEIENAKRSATMAKTYYQSMNKLSFEPQFMDTKN